MKDDVGLEELRLLRADGGAAHNDLLLQLQADILQVLSSSTMRLLRR